MELTRQGIENLRFTCVKKKYYVAEEVDKCLDELATAADQLQVELANLRQNAEVAATSPAPEAEVLATSEQTPQAATEVSPAPVTATAPVPDQDAALAAILVSAQKNAQEIINKANEEGLRIIEEAKNKCHEYEATNQDLRQQTINFKNQLHQYTQDLDAKLDAVLASAPGSTATAAADVEPAAPASLKRSVALMMEAMAKK